MRLEQLAPEAVQARTPVEDLLGYPVDQELTPEEEQAINEALCKVIRFYDRRLMAFDKGLHRLQDRFNKTTDPDLRRLLNDKMHSLGSTFDDASDWSEFALVMAGFLAGKAMAERQAPGSGIKH